MRALVVGAGGQLGSELVRQVTGAIGLTHAQLSVADLEALNAALPHYQPDVVFNCAAYNAVDDAEAHPEAAFQVNAQGAFNVALACAQFGVRLIHFSTNFVFDGTKMGPYVEADEVGPLGVYAKSKLEGERLISMVMPASLIVRTAALYAPQRQGGRVSFPERIVEIGARDGKLAVVDDQAINPTYVPELASAAVQLAATDLTGVVHVVGAGCCTWHELAVRVLDACGVPAEVEAIPSAARPGTAPRPPNGCLASSRVPPLRPWLEGIQEWASQRPKNP